MRVQGILTITAAAILLGACGGSSSGGGGGGGPTPNTPPTADAGPDQNAAEKAEVQLAGSGTDADGGTLSYSWSQTSGPTGAFSSTTAADATFTVPLIPVGMEEDIVLRLTVSDGQGGSTSDDMTITAASADYVVFMADRETDGVIELYLYDTQADSLIKLNGALAAGGNVIDFDISPDGASVAYRADQDTAGVIELFVAAADGSGTTKVNAAMANLDGDVAEYEWSPDGAQVVYTADADIDNITEVFLVDRDGANHDKINGSVGGGAVVFLIQPTWSPDGRYIAQLVVDTATGRRLGINTHDTTVGGFSSVRIATIPAAGAITAFDWAPDSSVVTYTADQDIVNVRELYSALPDGSGISKINPALPVNRAVIDFEWAPDSSRIAYRASQDTEGVLEVYSSLPDGGGNARINPTPPLAGGVSRYVWSADSTRIAYVAAQDTVNVQELYASDPDGTNNTKLNGALVAGGTVFNYLWSTDGSRVAYQADQETDGIIELYAANADGTMNVKLSGALVAGGSNAFTVIDEFNMWSPDGSMFVYPASTFTAGVFEHFVTEDGTNQAQVTLTAAGALSGFAKWSADGSSVVYASDQDTVGVEELYIGSADGMSNTKISGTMIADGDIYLPLGVTSRTFDWSP